LRSHAKTAGMTHELQQICQPEAELWEEIKWAYQTYNRLKHTDNHRDTWLGQLVEAQVVASNQKKSTIRKQIRSTKWIQVMALQVKHAQGQDTHFQALFVVNAPNQYGKREDFTQR